MENTDKKRMEEIKRYLAKYYDFNEYSKDYRLVYAINYVYKKKIIEGIRYETAIALVKDILKELPFKCSKDALMRSLYRAMKHILGEEYYDLRAGLERLTEEFENILRIEQQK